MATEIRNVSVDPLTLPNPLQGTLKGGEAIVLSTATATLLALIPSLGRSFQVTDLGAGYAGETDDTEFGLDTSEAETFSNKTLTTCTLGSALACGGYDLSGVGVLTAKRATVAPAASTSGTPSQALTVSNAADLAITASTETPSIMLSVGSTRTWATGALANQREIRIAAPSYAFAGASTITNAATVFITGGPNAGDNATITNSYGLWCGGAVRIDGSLALFGGLKLDMTDASGTPGAATINKPTGKVAVAIGASSVVVTNNLVTANSIVVPVLEFIDATFTQILSCVPGAGSFTITGNANATAATKISFVVYNPA